MPVLPEPLFLTAAHGQRFCIFYPAQTPEPMGAVLYLPPFAEEMNKARRMAAMQARALAAQGYAVLQLDPRGCGDSSGDFGDATWEDWVEDALLGVRWLREQTGAPLWLWGLRAGCLLATAAAARLKERCHFLFWQPASSGKLLLQQFLRLKVAGELMGGESKGVMESLRSELAQGHSVEVAGYRLHPQLAEGLAAAELNPPPSPGRLVWIEISAREEATLTPVSTQKIAAWQAAGFAVDANVVQGPAFWQTSEIEEAPLLIEACCTALPESVTA